VSTPDDRPLDDEELAALEYFVDAALPKGVPSMVRRLIKEVRRLRSSDHPGADGWQLEDPPDPCAPVHVD
jgi:hypothetical protein